MNFLAHAFLSDNNEQIMLGNYLADFLRGKEISQVDAPIAKGIELHRLIDNFTDHHPIVEDLIEQFRDPFKKFSGVVVDVWFDFFLANSWRQWTKVPFEEFKQNFYTVVRENHHLLNSRAHGFTHYMLSTDAFESYRTIEGISLVLRQMSGRTSFVSHMELGGKVLNENHGLVYNAFHTFFPELKKQCDSFIKDNLHE